MNNLEIFEKLLTGIDDLIQNRISKQQYPKIIQCRIMAILSDGKFNVKHNGEIRTVKGKGSYKVNDMVEVVLPNGKWQRAFIVFLV